jgi:hypothetical protein
MERPRTYRPSPALIVALVALVAAMSGAAIALPGKSTVGSADLKRNAVRSKHIQGKTVHGSDVENDALKGKQVFEEKLAAVPEAESVQSVRPFGDSFERAAATDGPDATSARASAPKLPLASAGQLAVYAKCFRSTDDDTVFARVYIETSADGAVFEGGTDQLEGSGGFLNVATAESDRELLATSAAADASVLDTGSWYAMAPDGTGIGGTVAAAAKNGTVDGDGVFGDGSVCLFGGEAVG